MSWRSAYFAQAQDDYAVFCDFKRRTDIRMCQKLHYLQMATEKLAKAFLSPPAGGCPPMIHTALVRFLQISKGRPEIRRRMGYGSDHRAYCSYIDSLIGIAMQIEALAPTSGKQQPNPEYPWVNQDGAVMTPATYSFSEFRRQDLAKFQNLTNDLFRIFATI